MSKKLKVQLNINGEALKKKLNIKDGVDGITPKKGIDYFDGQDAVVDEAKIALEASTIAVESIKSLIPTIQQLEEKIPILGESIRDSLELLPEEGKLKIEAIGKLREELDDMKQRGGINTGFKAFRNLTDVPHSYKGQAGKVVKVKVNETGLEFGAESGSQSLQQVTDIGATTTHEILGVDPTTAPALATKRYVDALAGGGMKSWFFTKTASDIAGMYKATTTLPPGGIQTITTTAVKNTETVVAEFLTELQTNEYRVTEGSRFFYVTANTDNDHLDITLIGRIYTTDIDGLNPVLLRTSTYSVPLTEIPASLSMNAWGSSLLIPTTTRVKFVISALNIHNQNHPVTLSVEDDTFSRLDVPSPVGVTDISGKLNIDQTTPQTTVGTFTFPQIIDSGLTPSLGVYSDANKQLTSTVPTSGILGHWSRTSPTLTPANANDRVNVTVASTADTGIPYCYNGSVTQSGSSDSSTGFDVIGGKFTTTDTFAFTGADFISPTNVYNYGVQNTVTGNAAHTRTFLEGEGGQMDEQNYAMYNLCFRGSGTPASNSTVTTPLMIIANYGMSNQVANYLKYNNASGTVSVSNYGGFFNVVSSPTLTAGTMTTTNYGFFAQASSAVVGSTTSYGAYVTVSGTGNTNRGFYNASPAVSLAHNMFGIAGINSAFGLASASTAPSAKVHIGAGSATAGTAPIKLTAGVNTTNAVAGQIEFAIGAANVDQDDLWFCITTGPARKNFILGDGTRLTSGRVPFATTNGRLTDDADMTFATDTLTVTKISGTTQITSPALRLTSSTPTTLAGDVNNWDVGNKSFIRAAGGAADRIVTGILASGVADGHLMIITNIGTTNKISFANESASSTAANRIITTAAGTVEIPPAHTIQLIYDATTARWREMSHL